MNLSAVLAYVILITAPCHAEDLRPDGIQVNDIVSDFRRSLPESERGRIDSIGLSDSKLVVSIFGVVPPINEKNGRPDANMIGKTHITLSGLTESRLLTKIPTPAFDNKVIDNADKVLVGMNRIDKINDESATCVANVVIYHKTNESEIMLLIPFTFKFRKSRGMEDSYSDLKVLSEDAIMIVK
jgi:hypothetical protein